MKKAVLNVAVGANYPRGQKRLSESLDEFGEIADKLFWTDWPNIPHSVTPYAFKIDAFLDARNKGYERVIWFDASCWLVKPLDQAWAQIERDGYLLGQEGWSVGQWCSDEVLEKANLTREQARGMTLIEGKMIGLNFGHPVGAFFFNQWKIRRDEGWFNGDWQTHRHDISAGAIIAAELGLTLTPHLIEIPRGQGAPHPDVYVFASGM